MNGVERSVQLLALTARPRDRARFVEEWTGDLAAARSVGLSRWSIVLAVCRVAAFLLWVRVRARLLRRRSRIELFLIGFGLGWVFVVAAVPLESAVPFVVLVLSWWSWRAVLAWVRGP